MDGRPLRAAADRATHASPPQGDHHDRRRTAFLVLALATASLAAPSSAPAQAPIKIGEINSFSGIGAPFTGPYRLAVEMAVEEVNAKGGVLGRKVEVIFRDDKGQPAEAVKHAQELVRVGEGRADLRHVPLQRGSRGLRLGQAEQDACSWPPSRSPRRSRGPRGTTTSSACGPTPTSRAACSPRRRARSSTRSGPRSGPNYEYGKRAWETFRDRLKELKPDVQIVGEHWPTLGKIEPGPIVTAILNQNPEALYVSLFGSDWLAFVREAQKRGLFQKTFVVGILLGEPEYIDPLKLEAPEGMLVTGYPWYDVQTPGAQGLRGALQKKTDKTPVLGSLVGYITYLVDLRGASARRAAPTPTSWWPPSRASRWRRRSAPSPSGPPTGNPPWARGWAPPSSTPSAASASWSTTSTSRARRCCRPTTR